MPGGGWNGTPPRPPPGGENPPPGGESPDGKAPPRTGEPGNPPNPWGMLGRWFASSSAQFCGFGGESGRQHRAEVRVKNWVRWLDSTTTKKKRGRRARGRTRRGSGAHRHARHRLITLTSLYRWVERLGGTEKRAGKSAGELELAGARRILRKSAGFGFFSFFSRGGIRQGTRAFGSDAGSMNRVSRARSRREDDILTLSTAEPSASAGRYHPPLL